MLDRVSAQYRLGLLKAYIAQEKRAIAAVRSTATGILAVLSSATRFKFRDYPALMREMSSLLSEQRKNLTDVTNAAYGAVSNLTLAFHEQVSGRHFVSQSVVDQLTKQARSSIIAGKTVGDRIVLLAEDQKNAARLRILRGLKRNEDPANIAKAVEKYYRGVVSGDGGPAYAARRLVQSEMTRFNGDVAVRGAELLRKEFGLVTIFEYRTQGDERVRDLHAAQEGNQYVEDDVPGQSSYAPVSEAQSYLSDPNCRCWLDIAGYL